MEPSAIHLILPDGDPDGVVIAEIQDWSGQIAIFPRDSIGRMEEFGDFSCPGIYLLVGENQTKFGEEHIYVGESESILTRLKQHIKDGGKNFWKRVIILRSKSGGLNKAHIKSIESILIRDLEAAKTVTLVNSNKLLSNPHLALHDRINVDKYITRFKMILKSLGLNFFSIRKSLGFSGIEGEPPTILDYSNPIFEINTVGARGYGRVVGQNFVVAKDSTLRFLGDGQYGFYARQMINRDIMSHLESNFYVLTRDTAFASHSLAASVIAGTQRSGWTSWKIKGTKITFRE